MLDFFDINLFFNICLICPNQTQKCIDYYLDIKLVKKLEYEHKIER